MIAEQSGKLPGPVRVELGALAWLAPVPLQASAVLYLAWAIDARPGEILGLVFAFIAIPMFALLVSRLGKTEEAAISRGFQAAEGAVVEDALDAVSILPEVAQHRIFMLGLSPVATAPVILYGVAASLSPAWWVSIALVSVISAGTSSTLVLCLARRRLAPACAALSLRTQTAREDVMNSGASFGVSGFGLAIALPALVGFFLVIDASSHSGRQQAEREAVEWARRAVSSIARGDSALPLPARVKRQLPAPEFWSHPLEVVELAANDLGGGAMDRWSPDFVAVFLEAVREKAGSGSVTPRGGEALAAFETLADGRVVVARVDRRALSIGPGPFGSPFFGVVFGLLILGILLARLAWLDLAQQLEGLRRQAESLAGGDLRSVPWSPGRNTLGEVSKKLLEARSRIRSTVARTAETSAEVEQSVEELASVLGEIIGASSDRSEQLSGAHRLMSAMTEGLGLASRSAEELRVSIDVSNHAVVELGAAGSELNETSSILTAKVDEVSNSLEQMVASVKQISATTGRLAEASEETSSSMEEMASAMRAVDTSAETTANLSRDVVAKAELGQAKVVQTIEGMEAIREATDVAESVIRGLGVRTHEIGGILDVIEDVADETNLLALNAAIIAAQAGEHGKAFSVVAEEIKELADRVLASTKEIGGLIRSVQEESENAIGAIEAGSASVMSGVDLSAEAGRTLEEITEASRESGTRISEIVNSVREQTKAASHVVTLMERVRDSADQIGEASSEQDRGNEIVYRSARTMREVVQQVRRTTENQIAGVNRMRENGVGVEGAIARISGSLAEQSAVCSELTETLEGVTVGNRSSEERAARVRDAMRLMASRANELSEDAKRFRV